MTGALLPIAAMRPGIPLCTARRLLEGGPAEIRVLRRKVLESRFMPRPECPPIAADVIVEIGDRIVLIERKNFPLGWAIPGGFVEFGESVEQAAVREVREETSLEVELRALLGVYSRPDRDPRGHTVTVVYVAAGRGTPVARDDAKGIGLFAPECPPSPLAFDHAEILADYRRFLETGERPAPWRC